MLFQTLLLSTLPLLSLAKTDLAGCTSSISGNSYVYWVPETGEICSILDCGGGRAPPKTTAPGCAAYSGTASYSPSYIAGWGPNGKSASATPSSAIAIPSSVVSSGAALVTGTGSGNGSVSGLNGTTTGSAGTVTNVVRTSTGAGAVPTQSGNSGAFVGASLVGVGGALLGAIAML